MRFLVTCGPTYEPLDQVRRLTNFSTGKLGVGLANHFVTAGHEVTLLKGYYSTSAEVSSVSPITFTTTDDLLSQFRIAAQQSFDAVFHAAAVSDFQFGQVFRKRSDGSLESIHSGKFSTRDGNLFAELVPTPKLIQKLRRLFPVAQIIGWKYEVDGTREDAIRLGREQITANKTNFCVVNGPAYGDGFGVVSMDQTARHCADAKELYVTLTEFVTAARLRSS